MEAGLTSTVRVNTGLLSFLSGHTPGLAGFLGAVSASCPFWKSLSWLALTIISLSQRWSGLLRVPPAPGCLPSGLLEGPRTVQGQARGHTPLLLLPPASPERQQRNRGNMSNLCKICGWEKESKREGGVITAETEMKTGFRVGGGRGPRSRRAKQHEMPSPQAFPVSALPAEQRILPRILKEWSRTLPPRASCFPGHSHSRPSCPHEGLLTSSKRKISLKIPKSQWTEVLSSRFCPSLPGEELQRHPPVLEKKGSSH